MTVRTRFAPSPTGYLHVGGARTALYAWLYARQHKGEFILRVEDTDRERSTQESIDAILQGMEWLGLDYDEGPFYQTHRMDRYKEVIQDLLDSGNAYRCTCSKERLQKLREDQLKAKTKPRYDGCCRQSHIQASSGADYVVRFKNPEEGEVIINDLVYGDITVKNSELDDLIIARTDGTPTYNFTVVVDDMDMKISHVIRGDDHINNTPRQINILRALDVEIPKYAHLPMILGEDGKRLSKRHGAVSVLEFRRLGYLPHALINYIVRLGWSFGDQEIFSQQEMIDNFNLQKISRGAAAFNMEKLNWLNHHYIKESTNEELANELQWQFDQVGIKTDEGSDSSDLPNLVDVVIAQKERCKTLAEMQEKSRFFYQPVTEFDEGAANKHLTEKSLPVLTLTHKILSQVSDWKKETIHEAIQNVLSELELKMAKVAQPLRVAVTGNTISPSIDDTLSLLGKGRTLERLQNAIDWIHQTN